MASKARGVGDGPDRMRSLGTAGAMAGERVRWCAGGGVQRGSQKVGDGCCGARAQTAQQQTGQRRGDYGLR